MIKEIIIDAQKQKLGRIASEVAKSLRGKTTPDFLPNRTTFPKIIVKNVDKINMNVRRLKKNNFSSYSGYPGGRKTRPMFDIAKKDIRELLRRAVWGMLPKNKLRSVMIKNLIIYHGNDK
ncbi:MAG: 50S ribosomal protein L13 [Patescibacteria group bacterium]